jgi:hypothetical protein
MMDNRNLLLPISRPEEKNISIFDFVEAPLSWESEWWGMPEFVMGNTEPKRKITVSFSCDEDAEEFARRLGIRITTKTDSVWFPAGEEYVAPKSLRWVDGE